MHTGMILFLFFIPQWLYINDFAIEIVDYHLFYYYHSVLQEI